MLGRIHVDLGLMRESNGNRTYSAKLMKVDKVYNNSWEAMFDELALYSGNDIRYAIQAVADGRAFFEDTRPVIEVSWVFKKMTPEQVVTIKLQIKETAIMLDTTPYKVDSDAS